MSFLAALSGFVDALRAAGIPVGVDRTILAVRALEACADMDRERVRQALRVTLVRRKEDLETFDVTFARYWRAGRFPPAEESDPVPAGADESAATRSESGAEQVRARALGMGAKDEKDPMDGGVADAAGTASAREHLRHRDFATMDAAQMAEAERQIEALGILLAPVRCHRLVPDPRGPRIDMRATLRASLRAGGDCATLARCGAGARPPALVVLCDVSGSMQRYARPMLALMRAAVRRLDTVHCFVFGTRLSDVTRSLARRQTSDAAAALAQQVRDHSGGTRIGACLREFNRRWAGRLLSSRATVLLVTDGLERGDQTMLGLEAARLRRSCRRIVWLNPLLRFEGFAPLQAGVRALLPCTDMLLATHDLASVEAALRALASR